MATATENAYMMVVTLCVLAFSIVLFPAGLDVVSKWCGGGPRSTCQIVGGGNWTALGGGISVGEWAFPNWEFWKPAG